MDKMLSQLKIKSFNVNSIGNKTKRGQIFEFIRKDPADIYVLIDTRIDKRIENQIRTEWGGKAIFSSYSSQARGVGIFFSRHLDIEISELKADTKGNSLQILFKFDNKTINLNCIYGPNNDQPDFFLNMFSVIEDWQPDFSIFCGDFNLVLNQNFDTFNYKRENNIQARNTVLNAIQYYELVDIWRHNNPDKKKYTWVKKDSINPKKCARLDFFLISEGLIPYVKDCAIEHGAFSDHSVISLAIDFSNFTRGPGFYKFNNSLLKSTEYVGKVKQIIKNVTRQYSKHEFNNDFWENLSNEQLQEIDLNINPQLFFDVLLMEVRGMTIAYSSTLKKLKNERFKKLKEDIETLTQQILDDPNNIEIKNNLAIFQNELELLIKHDAEGAAVRTKAFYSIEGEKPSNFFCKLEKNMGTKKFISELRLSNGRISRHQKEIETEIFNFYKNLYKKTDTPEQSIEEFLGDDLQYIKKLSEAECLKCEGDITLTEISNYLLKLRNNKSPGTSGFTGEFYKFFYPDIKHRLHESINHTYKIGKLSPSQNLGITTLIPKADKNKIELKNWRPLCLLNTQYKIISGCLAERLKSALQNIINHDQKGYLPGRFIGEINRTTYDTIQYAKDNNAAGIILLCDFEKAFDSLSHSMIYKTLKFFNFGPSFLKWIDILMSDFYCVLNNAGHISEKYKLERGARQGDPISGYLFILCIEILAAKLRLCKNIEGFKIHDRVNLIEGYADDLTIFLNAIRENMQYNENNLRTCLTIIQSFSHVSGLKINIEKTSAVWFGAMENANLRLCQDIGLQWAESFKLLGMYFDNKLDNLQVNADKSLESIKSTLNNWRYRYLTPFGKITVIKTLALSKLTHLAIIMPELNDLFAQKLEKLFFHFIWNGKPDRVNRRTMKVPERLGGANMVCTKTFWKALKISWLRRLIYSKSAWVNILEHSLFEIGVCKDSVIQMGNNCLENIGRKTRNPFWKQVFLHSAEMLSNVPFYCIDKFGLLPICGNSFFKIQGDCIKQGFLHNRYDIQVLDFINPENGKFLDLATFNKQNVLNLNFLQHGSLLSSIKEGARNLNFNFGQLECHPRPRQPILFSILTSKIKGCKTFYKILNSKNLTNYNSSDVENKWHTELGSYLGLDTWNSFYSLCANIKYHNNMKYLQFQILQRSLRTNRILCKFLPKQTNMCTFCNNSVETISHLFFDCGKTSLFLDSLNLLLQNVHIFIKLTRKNMLFGNANKSAMDVENLLILYSKSFIWYCRQRKTLPTMNLFKSYIKPILTNLEMIYAIIKQENVFNECWYNFYVLIIEDGESHESQQLEDQQPQA